MVADYSKPPEAIEALEIPVTNLRNCCSSYRCSCTGFCLGTVHAHSNCIHKDYYTHMDNTTEDCGIDKSAPRWPFRHLMMRKMTTITMYLDSALFQLRLPLCWRCWRRAPKSVRIYQLRRERGVIE
jgi:hypothetical protein